VKEEWQLRDGIRKKPNTERKFYDSSEEESFENYVMKI